MSSNHRVYLMKNSNSNGGAGSIVGLLKVGEKRLFVYDEKGKQYEETPLCVLDFYVCESCQRQGYGRRLFDTMLSMEGNIKIEHCAIDTPSEKSMKFLSKHYNLKNAIPQVNNYVVFAGFFNNTRRNRNNKQQIFPKSAPYNLRPSAAVAPSMQDFFPKDKVLKYNPYETESTSAYTNNNNNNVPSNFNIILIAFCIFTILISKKKVLLLIIIIVKNNIRFITMTTRL
jgi:alpha-tubulin N-acetyltransferase 1